MKRRSKRRISLIISLFVVAVAALGQQFGWFDTVAEKAEQTQPGRYRVSRFIDGDTIAVDMHGTKETIRMIGVDTPETHKPGAPVQCYGPAAAAYTKNIIGEQTVRLEADPTNQNRDRYNRLLRYVYLPDGRLVQQEIIKNGYGFAYTLFPFEKTEQFIAEEQAAKTASKGLWSNCTVSEEKGRKQTNDAQ